MENLSSEKESIHIPLSSSSRISHTSPIYYTRLYNTELVYFAHRTGAFLPRRQESRRYPCKELHLQQGAIKREEYSHTLVGTPPTPPLGLHVQESEIDIHILFIFQPSPPRLHFKDIFVMVYTYV